MYIAPIYVVSWTMTNEDVARNKQSEIVKAAVEMSYFHFVQFGLCEKAWVALVFFGQKRNMRPFFSIDKEEEKPDFFLNIYANWFEEQVAAGLVWHYTIQ